MPPANNERSGRGSADADAPEPMEQTPLLNAAEPTPPPPRRLKAWASTLILVLVLIAGFFIGVYLLIIQSESEDILPPEVTMRVVKAGEFDSSEFFSRELPKNVVIRAGATQECYDPMHCAEILEDMESRHNENSDLTPFDLVSMSDGRFMFDRTWRDTFDNDPESFVIAMLGNHTFDRLPFPSQVYSIMNFITYHQNMEHFDPLYVIILDQTQLVAIGHQPNRYLIEHFENLPHFCGKC